MRRVLHLNRSPSNLQLHHTLCLTVRVSQQDSCALRSPVLPEYGSEELMVFPHTTNTKTTDSTWQRSMKNTQSLPWNSSDQEMRSTPKPVNYKCYNDCRRGRLRVAPISNTATTWSFSDAVPYALRLAQQNCAVTSANSKLVHWFRSPGYGTGFAI